MVGRWVCVGGEVGMCGGEGRSMWGGEVCGGVVCGFQGVLREFCDMLLVA